MDSSTGDDTEARGGTKPQSSENGYPYDTEARPCHRRRGESKSTRAPHSAST